MRSEAIKKRSAVATPLSLVAAALAVFPIPIEVSIRPSAAARPGTSI